jgi:hypothetical protein
MEAIRITLNSKMIWLKINIGGEAQDYMEDQKFSNKFRQDMPFFGGRHTVDRALNGGSTTSLVRCYSFKKLIVPHAFHYFIVKIFVGCQNVGATSLLRVI